MPFPFSAIVGQDLLKRALLLGIIQPALGGVVVRGTKGVAKSTAVRALAALLPPIETVAGCPFQRRPGEIIADWPLPEDAAVVRRPVPLVELPLGATEDRVLGTLHLEKALRGERAFEPGLLAAANRGLLYIDEVNLLPDALVDVLLDVAASGIHRVEREGISLSHPARFLLVGTMNPEEGDLRPQLLDRFGLAADVTDLTNAGDRAEAVRRRLAYESDPAGFLGQWGAAESALAERVERARRLLPEVRIGDELLTAVSERCLVARVEGLRADLTLCRAACAWAAFQGRLDVEAADLDAVAELALAHRRGQPPEPPQSERNDRRKQRGSGPANEERSTENREPRSEQRAGEKVPLLHFDSEGDFRSHIRLQPKGTNDSPGRGRISGRNPRHTRGTVLTRSSDVAWASTFRSAAVWQITRGRRAGERLILTREDLRFRSPFGPSGCLLLFVVDASGSMAAWRRMRQTKAAVLALLGQAYRQRDRVSLIAFRGTSAEVLLRPTRGLNQARQAVEDLRIGGATPLAEGLIAATRLVRRERRREPKVPIWTVMLTDGRANVGLGGDPWQEALTAARQLAMCGAEGLVVDTETGWPRFGRAEEVAQVLGARCVPLEDVLGSALARPEAV